MSTGQTSSRGKTWLYFHRWLVQTTDVSFQEFLASRGLEIPLTTSACANTPTAQVPKSLSHRNHRVSGGLVVIGDERLHEHRVRAMLPETAGLHITETTIAPRHSKSCEICGAVVLDDGWRCQKHVITDAERKKNNPTFKSYKSPPGKAFGKMVWRSILAAKESKSGGFSVRAAVQVVHHVISPYATTLFLEPLERTLRLRAPPPKSQEKPDVSR